MNNQDLKIFAERNERFQLDLDEVKNKIDEASTMIQLRLFPLVQDKAAIMEVLGVVGAAYCIVDKLRFPGVAPGVALKEKGRWVEPVECG